MKFILRALAASLAFALATSAGAASVDEFYKGKNARIVVGFSAGGGFDTYARALARHMGKHIPGGPTIVVENMTGAGSLIAANHVYNVAKPDGLTLGFATPGIYIEQLAGRKEVQHDWLKFSHVGSPESTARIW